jgi:hypothetical protein
MPLSPGYTGKTVQRSASLSNSCPVACVTRTRAGKCRMSCVKNALLEARDAVSDMKVRPSEPVSKSRFVGLEFLVAKPRLGGGRGPYGRRPTGPGSVPQRLPCVDRRTSAACGPPTTRESVPRWSKPETRQASVPDHRHSRTAPGRGILAASSRSRAPRRGVTRAHAARS